MPMAAERKLDLALPQRVSREQLQEVLDRAQAEQRNAAWVCMALDCSLRGLALLVEHHGLRHHPWVQRMLPNRRRDRAAADVTGSEQVRRGRQPTAEASTTKPGEKTAASESSPGATPAESSESQDTEQDHAGEAPAATATDQAEVEDVAATPQHLCARCLKADVCPTPEVLSGYRPEVPPLPYRLAVAVEVEVTVMVRRCRYYLPAPAAGGEAAD